MKRHTIIVYAALFAMLGCLYASHAEAGYYGPGRPFGGAELAAVAQAEAYWGRQPALCTSRTFEVVADGALGEAEQGGPAAGRATQPTAPMACTMWLEEDATADPTNLCTIVRHEYGHWLGFGHEDPELAQMPSCVPGSTEASGGVYAPPSRKAVARQQAWAYWREWRAECREAGGTYRPQCWRQLRRFTQRLRARYG
jgi:hypothetical protein